MNYHNAAKEIFLLSKENRGIEADALKKSIIPSHLYRYGRLNTNTLESLRRKSIWLSNYKDLNDPFESIMKYDLEKLLTEYFLGTDFESEYYRNFGVFLSKEEILQIRISDEPYNVYYDLCEQKKLPSFKRPTKSQLQESILALFEKYRGYSYIGCFSEISESLLMWSHYADNGKGICVEYCLRDIDISFLFPVYYSEEMYEFSFKDLHTLTKNLVKAKDWEYEREWRIIYPSDRMLQNNHYVKIPIPTRILYGPRFEENIEDYKKELAGIAKDMQIPIFRTQLSSKAYRIIVQNEPMS